MGIGQVHFRAAGASGPVVCLFHESPLSSRIFERTLPLLGTRTRAYAFDTPGYGLSDPPQKSLEIPGYAAILCEAIERLGFDELAVAGTHTGASIALEVARQLSRRVTHVILSGVTVLTDKERAGYLRSWAPDILPTADGAHLTWAWERYMRLWGEDAPPELLNLGATALASNLSGYNIAYQAAFRYDPLPALRTLQAPLFLLNPEHDLLAHTDARVLQIVPSARLEHVPDLRGQLPWRHPQTYARAVTDFVGAA